MPGPSARPPSRLRVAGDIVETPQSTLLDVFDDLLNRGVMTNGEVMLGVAGIDLIYLRLSALLCAADRVLPAERTSVPLPPKASVDRRSRGEGGQPSGRRSRATRSRSARRRKS